MPHGRSGQPGKETKSEGLPEAVEPEQLLSTVSGLFNYLLDRPTTTPIEIERIQRALKPKGRNADPPRDIVCCLSDFKVKEEILQKDRNRIQLSHEGNEIHIFQHLSAIDLQRHRDLRPLLDVLQAKGVQGCTALIRVPEDHYAFCVTFNIPQVEVPNWFAEFRAPDTIPPSSRGKQMEVQET